MEKHLNLLGILYIVLGIFNIFGLSVAAFVMHGFTYFNGHNLPFNTVDLVMVIFAFEGVVSLAGIIAGIGLLKGQNWARWLMLILGFFGLLQIPFGTILGIYTIWVMLIKDGLSGQAKLA